MIRPHVRPLIRAFSDSALPAHDLLDDAINLLGVEPRHYWDFTQNRALFAGVDVGPVASTPGWSASALNLSARGMLMDGVSTAIITSPGVNYPLSLWVEIERVTDAGAAESIMQIDANTDNDRALLRINASDLAVATMTAATITQGAPSVTGSVPLATVTKIAGRFATNSIQACRNGTLATEDTVATVAATPTHIRFGFLAAGTSPFFGYIRRAAVFNSALSDANLQTITS
jgi:hypothetical protein